jgi:VWFA-related protein
MMGSPGLAEDLRLMCGFSPRTLFALIILTSCPVFSQQHSELRVGVPPLRSAAHVISVTEARDRIVRALNQQKRDRKLRVHITAVPLGSPFGSNALTEAREKNCELVLSTDLKEVRTSSVLQNNGAAGMDYVPVHIAAVEYRLTRVTDGAAFAIGSVQKEELTSDSEAASAAFEYVARQVSADIAKGGNVPHTSAPSPLNVSSGTPQPGAERVFVADPCAWMPTDIPHAGALHGAYEYTLSLPQKMPNFICDQDASRYRGKSSVPFDLITASLRYEDGKESYAGIKVNGKPALTPPPGIWSTGQFGSDLSAIFDPWNQPVFDFTAENLLDNRRVWMFAYRIVKQNDPLWRLHAEDQAVAPPYKGELWIDEKTGALLRFQSVAKDIPDSFPMSAAQLQIDYVNLPFGDGSSFVLPSVYTVTTTFRNEETTRNVVQFRNCQKFGAKTRVILKVPRGVAEDSPTSETVDPADFERQLDQNNTIYAILREQAVRDDSAQMEAEQRTDLELATIGALWKLKALERQREWNMAALPSSSKPAPPSTKEATNTLKMSVRLVPVTVVLRDSKGLAVGGLHKEDFHLFDSGKPQLITSFSAEVAAATGGNDSEEKSETPGQEPSSPGKPAVSGERDVAYVFDDIHTTFEDLASARAAALRRLGVFRPEDRAAIFTTSGVIGLDFTADRQKLKSALNALRPHPLIRGVNCPPMSDYMADLIVNQNDTETLKLATMDADNCGFAGMRDDVRAEHLAKSTAFEVLNASGAANQSTLSALREAVARTSAASGTRSIVLVSPGFLTLTPDTRESIMDLVDAATRADIVVNTLDVRGLYTPVVAPNSPHPAMPAERFRLDREEATARSDVMAELAYGTGGTFFHNNNDLEEGFRRTADSPDYIYILGFSPQMLDGKFHKLKVTVSGPAQFTVQARQSYYARKAAPGP